MKIYLALDCSLSLIVRSTADPITQTKFQRALQFMNGIVNKMAVEGIDIDLVEFSKEPKILKRSIHTDNDVAENFPPSVIKAGNADFLLLRDIILNEGVLNDFELILLLEGSNYRWIPHSFRLPCPIYFILLTDWPNSVSSQLISDLNLISSEYSCAKDANANPTIICKEEDVQTALDKIIKIPRLQREGTLLITEENKINVELIPGFPKFHVYSFDAKVIKYLDSAPNKNLTINLIGFTNSQNLFNVKSSSLAHCIKPVDNYEFFNSMAEVLGNEEMVAIFQHLDTGEEYALKPFRNDPSMLWVLCLQLIPSSAFKWGQLSTQTELTKKCRFPEISYKANAPPQIHWIDQHGIQTDIQKLHRLLKRTDKVDLFYQEIQRISNNAIAFGYHNFAESFANLLDARCVNIPAECKAHLVRTTDLLKKGGFQLVGETKLIM